MKHGPNALNDFIQRHQRLPKLGDTPAPYSYKGWMLRYVAICDGIIPEMNHRWSYHQRLMRSDVLPSDPIPRIVFEHTADPATMKALLKWIAIAEQHGRTWDGFGLFIEWLGYGLAVSKDPSRLPEDVQIRLYKEVQIHLLLQHPYDFLGELLASRKAPGWNPHAFYPTPHAVVELMVQMQMDSLGDKPDQRTATICDPCSGTARFLLHASNRSLRLSGIDVDSLVCKIAAINGALYAPWLSFPIPERLFMTASPAVVPTTSQFAIHQHHTYEAMTQTCFQFAPEEPVPA